MRKISADYIFPGEGPLLTGHVMVMEDTGKIVDIVKEELAGSDVERHKGIISPGFVNSHCHLELSHLKGMIPPGIGLDQFIRNIESLRRFPQEEMLEAAVKAEKEMIRNGIVAVGDISNTDTSFKVKENNNLYYHTFIELLGFHPDRAERAMQQGEALYRKHRETVNTGGVSLTPHAPYSASVSLLRYIDEFAAKNGGILTLHNQESEEENLFFKFKEGKIAERIMAFGYDISFWQPTGKSSLKSTLVNLSPEHRLQLVHNTYTTPDDISWAEEYSRSLWWCFCPAANLYIENRLPDFSLFKGLDITVGTDSLASNTRLSILEELKIIAKAAPELPLESLLAWATSSGARYLGIDNRFGYLKPGRRPGVLLLSTAGHETPSLDNSSEVEVLYHA